MEIIENSEVTNTDPIIILLQDSFRNISPLAIETDISNHNEINTMLDENLLNISDVENPSTTILQENQEIECVERIRTLYDVNPPRKKLKTISTGEERIITLYTPNPAAVFRRKQEANKSYHCNICDMKLKNARTFREHKINRHGIKTDHKCPSCNKVFHSRSGLRRHFIKLHCPTVNKGLLTEADSQTSEGLLTEADSQTSEDKSSSIPTTDNVTRCVKCNITFSKVDQLRLHLASVHEMKMEDKKTNFPNKEAFLKWKANIERKEMSKFVKAAHVRRRGGLVSYYVCHRSGHRTACGKYAPKMKEGKPIRIAATAGSCKLSVRCTAGMCSEEKPDGSVYVKYCLDHYGHGKGTVLTTLSVEEQSAIQENVSNGVPVESLLKDLRDMNSTVDSHQLFLLRQRDKRFFAKAFEAEFYNTYLNESDSIDQWVRECSQMDDSPVLFYSRSDVDEDYILIIMTEFQKQILMTSPQQLVCLDPVHHRKRQRFNVTALLTLDDFEVVFPVAYCFSRRVNKTTMTQFFTSIKESTGPLSFTYFMTDMDQMFFDAWQEVMEGNSVWIWNIWYIACKVQEQLRVIKDISKRSDGYHTMKSLWECKNEAVMQSMLKNFVSSLEGDPSCEAFLSYFMRRFGSSPKMWAYCYHSDVKWSSITHLWTVHRGLRYYLKLSRTERLDKSIFILMKFVRCRMLERLTNVLDDEKSLVAVEAINKCHLEGLEIPVECMSPLSDKIWLIQTPEDASPVYVTREFDSCPENCTLRCSQCDLCVHMFICSCLPSLVHANICQHVHAVVWRYLTPQFPPPEEGEEGLLLPQDISEEYNNSDLLQAVLKRTHDVYRFVTSSRFSLSNDSLSSIIKMQNRCLDICSGKKTTVDAFTQVFPQNITFPDLPSGSEWKCHKGTQVRPRLVTENQQTQCNFYSKFKLDAETPDLPFGSQWKFQKGTQVKSRSLVQNQQTQCDFYARFKLDALLQASTRPQS